MNGYSHPTPQFSFGSPITPVIKRLIVANAIISALYLIGTLFAKDATLAVVKLFWLDSEQALLGGRIWQFATYTFLHDLYDPFHVLMNMILLWMFGRDLERVMGGRRFFGVYLACGIVGGICFSIFALAMGGGTCVGASGSVIGVLAIYALYYPNRQVIFLLFPIKVKYLAMFLIGMDLYMAILTSAGGSSKTAHLAHLGGAATGFLYVRFGPVLRDIGTALERNKTRKTQASEEEIRKKVDQLLQKIADQGISTLTRKEKTFLKNASKRYQKPPRQKMPL